MGRKGVRGRERSKTQSFGQSTGPGTDLRHFEKWEGGGGGGRSDM